MQVKYLIVSRFVQMLNRDPFYTSPHMTLIYQTQSGITLWLGDYNAALDVKLLKKFSIQAVLTVAAELDVSYQPSAGIKHKVIAALDIPSFKLRPYFAQSRQFILQSMARKYNILVHCAAGISRSAAIVIAFLMQRLSLPFRRAFALVKNKRHLVDPNYGFKDELVQYEKKILGLKQQVKNNKTHIQTKHVNYISEYLNEQKNKQSTRLQSVFKKRQPKSLQSHQNLAKSPQFRTRRARVNSVSSRYSLPNVSSHQ